jgi:hypothetical protein
MTVGLPVQQKVWISGGLGGKCFTDLSYRSADGFAYLVLRSRYTSRHISQLVQKVTQARLALSFPSNAGRHGQVHDAKLLANWQQRQSSFTSRNTNNGQTTSGYSTNQLAQQAGQHDPLHPTLLRETSHLRQDAYSVFWVHNDISHLDAITGVTWVSDTAVVLSRSPGWENAITQAPLSTRALVSERTLVDQELRGLTIIAYDSSFRKSNSALTDV